MPKVAWKQDNKAPLVLIEYIVANLKCRTDKHHKEMGSERNPGFLSINPKWKILEKNHKHVWNPYEILHLWSYKETQI